MIVVYCQHRETLTSSERAMVSGMRDLPGVLIVNALITTGRRAREIDGIWLRPEGAAVIEAKGTAQTGEVRTPANGPWTVAGETAAFPSGPNPLLQARTGAQTLRRTLNDHGVDIGFIPAVVTISGRGLILEPGSVGDMPVLLTDDLSHLPGQLRPGTLTLCDVHGVLTALGLSDEDAPPEEELIGEGFTDAPPPRRPGPARKPAKPQPDQYDRAAKSSGMSSKDRRRARRFADLEAQTIKDWQRSNRRRLIASGLAAAVFVGATTQLPFYALMNGLVGAAIAASYQLALRRRLSGKRSSGPLGVAAWLLTLIPIWGIGTSLSWIAALPTEPAIEWPFIAMLSILVAAWMACAVAAGRSSFVHPPAIIIERFDEQGRPTGAFMVARTSPLHTARRDWRPPQFFPIGRGSNTDS